MGADGYSWLLCIFCILGMLFGFYVSQVYCCNCAGCAVGTDEVVGDRWHAGRHTVLMWTVLFVLLFRVGFCWILTHECVFYVSFVY